MPQKVLLIVAYAPSPNTTLLRDAVLRGARASAEEREVLPHPLCPFEAGPEDVKRASAVVLGTTENLGYMSGALKDFFDRSYYPCLEETQGMPFGLYIRAGHDGTGTRRAVGSITTGLRWRSVCDPVLCRGPWKPEFESECEELGMIMAAGLEAGVF